MKKSVLFLLFVLLFPSLGLAAVTGAIQFDDVNKTWPSAVTPIKNLGGISNITAVGKYSFVEGCINAADCSPYAFSSSELIAVNDGNGWSEPQRIQNMNMMIDPFIPMFPHTEESPVGWAPGFDSKFNYMISFFDGKNFSPAVLVPLFSADTPGRMLVSHHKLWVINYDNHRVFWTTHTIWNAAASLPSGTIVNVFADSLNDDIYALELDTLRNQYFLTHLLPDNQWDRPLYIDFFASPENKLTDLIVMNGGKTIGVMDLNNTDSSIFLSQDAGQSFVDTGNIPTPEKNIPHFAYVFNGNKGDIFWAYDSLRSPPGYYDTLAYMNPHAADPRWILVSLPESIRLTSYMQPSPWKPTGEDGAQFWVYGYNAAGQFKTYYYDLKLLKFIDASLNDAADHIDVLEAANQGKAFGLGQDAQGNYLALFFNGNIWKGVKAAGLANSPTPSSHFRDDTTGGGVADYLYKFIVSGPTDNIWLFTYNSTLHNISRPYKNIKNQK